MAHDSFVFNNHKNQEDYGYLPSSALNPAQNLTGYQGYAPSIGDGVDYVFTPQNTNSVGGTLTKYIPTSNGMSYQTNMTNTKPTIGQQLANNWGKMSLGEQVNTVVGTVGTLLNAYNGYRTGKLAREQFNHAKDMAERNYQNQRKMTNSQLEDRQKRRVLEANSAGRSMTSVADYMAKYGV